MEIAIYNPKGQKVVTLVKEMMGAGMHEIVWDGVDSSGRPVATGVYLYRLRADGRDVEMRKCLLMK